MLHKINNIILSSLGEQYKIINYSVINSLQVAIGMIEQIILIEMEKLISGEKISENSLMEARKIL